ncbi:hypothetical protein GCM10010331_49900 [Streptomyces xanthochromogenes]|uniref:hypothetical protein n=1 Tax=Streptomyces xanthochromogenes TaxID=67384 RepID=UPI001676EB96|nr:hypothetical protein [Streptomyces xanthochromogenes]GHB56032.1 hypothetical protein GCM10010331_49900 [Streptomyces xanthochromogenes]
MILDVSSSYWSTGIVLVWADFSSWSGGHARSGWHGTVEFFDDGFAGDNDTDAGYLSTNGKLWTRYAVADGEVRSGLSAAVDVLIADARKLGIAFRVGDGPGRLYYKTDGENPEFPPPTGWRELLTAEAERIGWDSYAVRPEAGERDGD